MQAEKLALKHLDRFLSRYPRFFVAPHANEIAYPGFDRMLFPSHYFGSQEAHNRLLLSEEFYDAFSGFDYLLIHHLDSLVFADSLEDWCRKGFDLVAPPWIPGSDLPWCKSPAVGNGGLSLRRVAAFQNVLRSSERWRTPEFYRNRRASDRGWLPGAARALAGWRFHFRFANGIRQEIDAHLRNRQNEDRFWWKYGRKYFPDFKIAPVDTALSFGFEANPRSCYELNGRRLPFGCHAWERYDKAFWEPFLLNDVRD